MASQTSVLTGALGALLGYVGSEVAEEVVFERLLWPQRFYNDLTLSTILIQSLFMTMGGPLHAAALRTLDTFREHGLYRGVGRGNLLGTAFYRDSRAVYATSRAGEATESPDRQARNAFWVGVAKRLDHRLLSGHGIIPSDMDGESAVAEEGFRFRTWQSVHYLTLRLAPAEEEAPPHSVLVQEADSTWRTYLGILLSETVAIVCAVASILLGAWWVAIYMTLPVVFKSLAAVGSVQREGLKSMLALRQRGCLRNNRTFHILDSTQGFLILKGPEPVVDQFFRHYGHPLRTRPRGPRGSRAREIYGMLLVYCFVFYFPAGLVLNIWMGDAIQYLWLAYQLYSVAAMHLVRLLGWQGYGRTEDRVARALTSGCQVWLASPGGATIVATVHTTFVPNVQSAKKMVSAYMCQLEGNEQD